VIAEVKVMQRMTEDGESQGLRIIAENAYDLATMRRMRAKRLKIACNGNTTAEMLAQILAPHRPGDKPITVSYRSERFAGDVDLSAEWCVNLDDALIERLREWLSPDSVEVVY
jgi:DNA polymerase III subunit alpha